MADPTAFLDQLNAQQTKDVAKQLLTALELLQGYGFNLDAGDPDFAREIKRRALAAIEAGKRLNL